MMMCEGCAGFEIGDWVWNENAGILGEVRPDEESESACPGDDYILIRRIGRLSPSDEPPPYVWVRHDEVEQQLIVSSVILLVEDGINKITKMVGPFRLR